MARLLKPRLFSIFENALRSSGWQFVQISSDGSYPRDYMLLKESERVVVRVYIWNITHGGGAARAKDEFRIQITGAEDPTGVQRFVSGSEGETLILGWWDEARVFAGFDFLHHQGALGSSPSIQIREAALVAASRQGVAFHEKLNQEIAVAFRPEFLGFYVANARALHRLGDSPAALSLLERATSDPASLSQEEIQQSSPAEREYTIVTTRQAVREANFRRRVLAAYENRCAMCGIQLDLLDAAHILPAAHPESTDLTENGVALCALHHRAYDKSLVTFAFKDDQFRTLVNERQMEELADVGQNGGEDRFVRELLPVLLPPIDPRDEPNAYLVTKANEVRGWVN